MKTTSPAPAGRLPVRPLTGQWGHRDWHRQSRPGDDRDWRPGHGGPTGSELRLLGSPAGGPPTPHRRGHSGRRRPGWQNSWQTDAGNLIVLATGPVLRLAWLTGPAVTVTLTVTSRLSATAGPGARLPVRQGRCTRAGATVTEAEHSIISYSKA